jgi:rhodanese-related sulfurtransferase
VKSSVWSINIRAAMLFASLTATTCLVSSREAMWRLFTLPGEAMTTASLGQVIKAITSPSTVIIDVRAPERFQFGHISNAINIPLHRLNSELSHFTNSQTLIFYGQNHSLDIPAMQASLIPTGFKDRSAVYEGGWDEWSELGLSAVGRLPLPAEEGAPKRLDDGAPGLPSKRGPGDPYVARSWFSAGYALVNRALQEPLRNVQELSNSSRQLDSPTNGVTSSQPFH